MFLTPEDIEESIKRIKSYSDLSNIRDESEEIFKHIYYIIDGRTNKDVFNAKASVFFSENIHQIKENASIEYFEQSYLKNF